MNKKIFLFIWLALVLLFSFWKLGADSVQSWDEGLYGINAMEMIRTGDYINYNYLGRPEVWNAKPPLMIWSIVASFKVFGYNEFALRFPSALSISLFFMVFFMLTRFFLDFKWSILVSAILLSSKGILGIHVGRTGDTDAMFMLWLFCTFLCYVYALEKEKYKWLILAGLSLGLAFYTKGLACLVFVPPLIIYTWYKGAFKKVLTQRYFWGGISLFFAITASWFLLLYVYGVSWEDGAYGTGNTLETMLYYDVYGRLFKPDFVAENPYKLDFVFAVIDTKFYGWSYVFYAAVLGFVGLLIYERGKLKLPLKDKNAVILSLSFIVFLSLFFTLIRNKNGWYYSPVLPFILVFTVLQIKRLSHVKSYIQYPFFLLAVVTMIIHFIYLNKVHNSLKVHVNEMKTDLPDTDRLYVIQEGIEPAELLYAYWLDIEVVFLDDKRPLSGGEKLLFKDEGQLVLQ